MSHAVERGRGPAHPGADTIRRRLPLPGRVAVAASALSGLVPSVLSALVLSSCSLIGGFQTGPEGRSAHDTDLRRLARDEQFKKALELTEPDDRGEIGDELLRLLHRGLLLHYAGEYEESNEALQRAEVLAEDRFTRSVSRAALSLVTSDRVLAWLPNDTERWMINYYGALNYLALGDVEEAAVEARRLSRQLELSTEDDPGPAEREVRRALRYFAGSVFEAAGDRNNASVSYRHVWSPDELPGSGEPLTPRFLTLYGAGVPDDLVGPPAPRLEGGGDVVVLLEHGLIAHRVERSLNVPLFPEESSFFHDGDADFEEAAAACIASRSFERRYDVDELFSPWAGAWSRDADGRCVVAGRRGYRRGDDEKNDDDDGDRSFYFMRVAWPEIVPSGLPGDLRVTGLGIEAVAPVQMASLESDVTAPEPQPVSGQPDQGEEGRGQPGADGSTPGGLARPGMQASLSEAAVAEFEDQLGGILIKAVARAVVKYGLARGIEKEVKEEDEVLGEIALITANAAAALLERADTRCWHLLPDRVSVVRLRLPAGRHPLTLRVETGGAGSRSLDMGEVTVREGRVTVLSARVWP